MPLLVILLIAVAQNGSEADEVVVTGRRTCDLSTAGRAISGKALDARAAEWRAGRTVRIAVPAGLRSRCLAKVMFRLHDRGVTTAEFVDLP